MINWIVTLAAAVIDTVRRKPHAKRLVTVHGRLLVDDAGIHLEADGARQCLYAPRHQNGEW